MDRFRLLFVSIALLQFVVIEAVAVDGDNSIIRSTLDIPEVEGQGGKLARNVCYFSNCELS